MHDPLATYLHDHLAGSNFAIELLDSIVEIYGEKYEGKSEPLRLSEFARSLVADIRQDQRALEEIIGHVGKTHFDLAQAAGWFSEKVSRFKLERDESGNGLGTFEALEVLALGIQGKAALWQVLKVIREFDSRIPDKGFDNLLQRAQEQHSRVEQMRRKQAAITFRTAES